MDEFIKEINEDYTPQPENSVFQDMYDEYQKVVLRSLLTTFGLDFIVQDQRGGDVDTIQNVRDTGSFRSKAHEQAYQTRPAYDQKAYHSHPDYRQRIQEARNNMKFIDDAYVPGNKVYYGKASGLDKYHRANLDHVVSAHEIHEDPGRIIADLKGEKLANIPENLQFTNQSLNAGKKDLKTDEYIKSKGDQLNERTKEAMREKDRAAREAIDSKIEKKYYGSEEFKADAAAAAAKLGVEMGIHQAVGFILIEIWFACKDEMNAVKPGGAIKDYIHAIKTGIEKGIKSCKEKYRSILSAFGEGVVSGIMTSLTTTLINTFVTTEKNTVRNMRHIIICITQAGNVLLFNPDSLLTGERIKKTSLILVTGASNLIGFIAGDYLEEKTPIGSIPEVGKYLARFISLMISGLLSCTFLMLLDRSKYMNDIIDVLNKFEPIEYCIAETSRQMKLIAAKLNEIDYESFEKECEMIDSVTEALLNADSETELEAALDEVYLKLRLKKSWEGDFDSFMSNSDSVLVFE